MPLLSIGGLFATKGANALFGGKPEESPQDKFAGKGFTSEALRSINDWKNATLPRDYKKFNDPYFQYVLEQYERKEGKKIPYGFSTKKYQEDLRTSADAQSAMRSGGSIMISDTLKKYIWYLLGLFAVLYFVLKPKKRRRR